MIRKTLVATVVAAALAAPAGASANHAGCLATAAIPTCTYTAIGDHQALGYVQGTYEIYVTRTISGEPTKVVLSSGSGAVDLADVFANAGELVTLKLNADGPGDQPVGAVSSGNTAGHLPV